MDFPKLRQRRGEFKMTAKTLKAGLMRETLTQEMEMLFEIGPTCPMWRAYIHPVPLAAFLTTDINVHRRLWTGFVI